MDQLRQEWTVERISKITGVTKNARHLNFQKLADEINAALAAQREISDALRELLQGSENHHLRQQLLQAQAAIAKAKAHVMKGQEHDALNALSAIDLSALDKHDQELKSKLEKGL